MRTRTPAPITGSHLRLSAAVASVSMLVACAADPLPPILPPVADTAQVIWSSAANLVAQEDTPLTFSLGVTSAPGVKLEGAVFYVERAPLYGRLEVLAEGFRYTPDPDFNGSDGLRFYAVVADVVARPAEVVLQVTPVNDAPTVEDLELFTDQGMPVDAQLAAADPEGDALTFSLALPTNDGTVAIDAATGALRFTPNPAFSGTAQFAVVASDGRLNSDPAVIIVNVLDRTGPALTAVQLGGVGILAERHPVPLGVSAGADADTMRVYGDVVTPTGWVAFAANRNVTLTPGDGVKIVQVEVRDSLQNMSGPVTGWALYDGNGPTGSLTLDRRYSREVTVQAALTYSDYSGVTGMSFDCGANPATWPAPLPATSVTLSEPDGTKVIEVCFKDGLGNVSGPFTDTVTLDRVAPTGGLALPAERVSLATIAVTVTTADALSPVTAVRIAGDVAAALWVAPTSPRNVVLSTGDGTKTLELYVADGAGNVGGPFPAVVTLDTTGPVILIDGGPAPITTVTDATFTLAVTDSGPVDLWCREGTGVLAACNSPYAWAGTIATGGNYTLTVTAVDDLGNVANGGIGRTWTWTVIDDDLACGAAVLYATDLTAGAPQPVTQAPWQITSDTGFGGVALVAATTGAADKQVTAATSMPADCTQDGRTALAFHARLRATLSGAGDRLRIELVNARSGRTTSLLDLTGPRSTTAIQSFGRGVTDVVAGDALTLRVRLDATGSADVGLADLRLVRPATPAPSSWWKAAESLLVSPRVLDVNPVAPGLEVLVIRGEGTSGWAQPWTPGAIPDPAAGLALAQAPVGSIGLSDMSGDGPPEFLTAGNTVLTTISPQGMALTSYTNALPARENPAIAFGEVDGATPVLADLDGDSNFDAVVGGSSVGNSQIVAFTWAGDVTGPVELWRVTFGGGGEVPDPAVVDIDGDGAAEVVVTTGLPGLPGFSLNRALVVLDGATGAEHARVPLGTFAEGAAWAPAIGDLDGDGKPEAVWITNNGNVRADSLGPGVTTIANLWSYTADSLQAGPAQAPVLGDLDGDGTLEVVLALSDGRVLVLDGADGSVKGWFAIADGLQSEWTAGPILGDINADGRPELILGAGDGRLWVVDSSLGLVHLAPLMAFLPAGAGVAPLSGAPALADIDNDGDLDLVATTADGWVLRLALPGSGTPPWSALPWPMWRRDFGATATLP